ENAEIELGGLAQEFLESLRVLQARHLHQDAVDALALDQRLDGAKLIDAPLNDLDRLVDGLADAFEDRGIRERERDEPATDIDDVERALAGGAHDAADRLRKFAQLGEAVLQVLFADTDLDRVATHDRCAGEPDARVAQHAAHVLAQRFELLFAHGRGVDLKQDVRAALQVEA